MFWLSCVVSNVVLALFLALAAWLVQRGLRRPALAHALWVLTLVKLVTPPLVTVPLQETPLPPACQDGTCRCGLHGPAAGQATLAAVLGAVWLAGALATAGAAAWRWARFRRLAAHAVPAPAEWQALAARLAADLGLRRPPAVMAVPGRLPPLVMAGWRRPRLLVPAALMGRLTGPQQAALVLHELTHLRRGDHLVRLLEMAVGVAYWWLPGVRRIGRQLRACEEACCDAAVVAREPQARRAYARLLLDVLDFVAGRRGGHGDARRPGPGTAAPRHPRRPPGNPGPLARRRRARPGVYRRALRPGLRRARPAGPRRRPNPGRGPAARGAAKSVAPQVGMLLPFVTRPTAGGFHVRYGSPVGLLARGRGGLPRGGGPGGF
jgi:beta-lactamase regulating signal transducer with metallopeptidase domain